MKDTLCQIATFGGDKYRQSIQLRDEILRQPLGLQFTKEELAQEVDSYHLICEHQAKVIGVIVFRPVNDATLKMRQVAIAKNWQRKGIGQKLIKFSEEFALKNRINHIELHARDTAIPFYLKLQYKKVGQAFFEVGIKHFKMEKYFYNI